MKNPPAGTSKRGFSVIIGIVMVMTATVLFGMRGTLAAHHEEGAVSENIQLIEEFVAAFNAKDVDKIMTLFSDDPVYHNMPGPPTKGAKAVRGLVSSFLTPAENVDWEILNIAESGDTVFAERIDRFVIGGKDIALPCNGVFEIRDGKIVEWRDYFDMATWTRQMGS